MRVTDRMIFDNATTSSTTARERAEKARQEVATGQRVIHPGDDPIAAGLIVTYRSNENRYSTLVETTSRASSELTAADKALEGFGDILSRARELAVQYSSSTYTKEQRGVAANEVSSLFQQSIALLNTRSDNRYIFAGTRDSSPPFDSSGAYSGGEDARKIEIAPGVYQEASIRPQVVLKGANGGVDALQAVRNLGDALAANDTSKIQATLDSLDASIRQTANGRSALGTAMAVFDSANAAAQAARDAEKENASNEGDADTFSSASKLALAQRALDASLTASVQSFSLTLLDKLK